MKHREIIVKAKNIHQEWVTGVPVFQWVGVYQEVTSVKFLNQVGEDEVDPETLCQFTGLQDMENNRIFDNDILRTGDGSDENPYKSWQVVWSKVIGQYRLKNINGPGELPIFPSNQRGIIINNAHNGGE